MPTWFVDTQINDTQFIVFVTTVQEGIEKNQIKIIYWSVLVHFLLNLISNDHCSHELSIIVKVPLYSEGARDVVSGTRGCSTVIESWKS